MLDQRQHPAADQVAGGLVAGDRQEQEEDVELHLGEALAIDLGAHQHADQVVARALPASQRQLVGIAVHRDGGRLPLLR